jgi:hypothetical protein
VGAEVLRQGLERRREVDDLFSLARKAAAMRPW